MRHRRTVPRAWLFALVVLLGCARPSETVRTHDLLRRLPAVAHGVEVTELDIGTAEAEPYLTGLSWKESTDDGTTFSWSDGPTTTMDFFLGWSRPAELVLRGLPWPGASSEEGGQALSVALNGADLGRLTMASGLQQLSLTVPAEVLAPGRNRLELAYAVVRSPAPDDAEQRALGVAWDWARLDLDGPLAAAAEPIADLLRDRLLLPPWSWIEYPVDIEPSSELVIDRLDGNGSLVVSRRNELAGPSTEIAKLSPGRRLRQTLAETKGTVWLTLSNPGPGPLRLRAPRLEARPAP